MSRKSHRRSSPGVFCCCLTSSDSDCDSNERSRMNSASERERSEREASCFSRAARSIRRALSRMCRDNPPSSPVGDVEFLATVFSRGQIGQLHRVSFEEDYNADAFSADYINADVSCTDFVYVKPLPLIESDQISSFRGRFESSSELQSESYSEDDDYINCEIEPSVPAVNCSVTNTQPTHPPLQTSSSCLRRSHSVPSLSLTTSAKNKTFTRSKSLPDMLFKPSCEEFTPDITVDENDETYRFQCSCPGLYQCSVTGLLFHMEGEGDVVYRIVPWNRRLLARHHKQPAGPLFDIKCLQQSVCRLHLPHCEIRSTGGGEFLSVAHVNDEGIEFIGPQKITETHVVINITGFSGFGNVKDEDSPAEPVRALVLLFYRPPADPDAESLLNVLLLPRNVVLRDVLRTRKKLVGDESYIETSPHCKLQPKQEYTLSTCPAEDSVLVQPTEAEFDCDNYDNYFPSFQVILETMRKHVKLFLRDTNSSHSVWERRVCLTGVKRSCGPSALNLSSDKRLLDIRSSFIEGISGPVLTSLLDKLFEKTVIAEAERESADEMQNRRDKARFVIDSVRKKGEAASSEMIEFLCEADPFLCEHLGLI
ncbi:NACHT, LRR and PYD domains-containing protein 1b allele 3-like isoform X1 [Micropterus salmoides]|uniref:NACHT, LRR and PYD domains-containing protein 1b allele 3-like isoform X1 n=1 Tax=Micropterus salmoides TaxID=27706 RepID=UPI0018ED67C3|nr:NACHT, LRR and PYD domains-containing protein 1b allele 3-like isoform X1 [Micropterus salmoides]